MAEARTLADLVDRISGHLALEQALFELTGTVARRGHGVDDTGAADVVALGRACTHHAWRIEQWLQRLPALADPAPANTTIDLEVATTDAAGMILRALADEWLPALAQRYEEHLSITEPALDAPTWQTLRRALNDLESERDLVTSAVG